MTVLESPEPIRTFYDQNVVATIQMGAQTFTGKYPVGDSCVFTRNHNSGILALG